MFKTSLSQLALFGGKAAFSQVLHVGRPNIGDQDKLFARFKEIMDRRWFTNHGPVVIEFEKRLSEFTGAKHCIAMTNATIALEIAIRALEMKGEVIVPAWTFVATAHALQWQEVTPVFCDVDPDTHNLDPHKVESLITPRTSGIIGVHLWGRGCAVEELAEITRRRKLKLLFDAAHAFACSNRDKMIGGFGDAEVFSFHATKFMNSFEGGCVATNNDELAARIRLMTNFGFAGYDRVNYIGTNGKMSEISAAMGLTSMESMADFITMNRRHWKQYKQELAGLPGLSLIEYDEREQLNYQYIVLEIDQERAGVHRDWILEALQAENVMARRYFYPGVHRMEPYRSYFPHAGLLLPVTEALAQRVLILPTGTAMGETEISEVCAIIRLCLKGSSEMKERLSNYTPKVTPNLT